jgi:peptidoglycan/LPS O-acetylase OafA/YrhL
MWFLGPEDPWLNPLMISLFAILVFGLATSKGVIARMLSCKAVVYAGEVSFSLYMIHGLMQKVFKVTLPSAHFVHASSGARLGVLLVYAVGLGVGSVVTYTLIERPARQKLRTVLAPQRKASRGAGVTGDLAPAK